VLASRGDLSVHDTIDLSGTDGGARDTANNVIIGYGGPGAAGDSLETGSKPPPADGGDGGRYQLDAVGPGHTDWTDPNNGGSGAGYGGRGGDGLGGTANGEGGPVYGDTLLTELFGGSGAGGVGWAWHGGGGGGGGALELVASGELVVNGRLDVSGSNAGWGDRNPGTPAGGGSGGGLILAANALTLDTGADVDASGGLGYDPVTQGRTRSNEIPGGGGGGRVALYYNTLTYSGGYTNVLLGDGSTADVPTCVNIEGGDIPTWDDDPGDRGTFYDGSREFPFAARYAEGVLILIR
jgi:hypothetical protein